MKNRAALVGLVSGALGFLLGLVRFPTWQVAIESAQVIAGLVHYPAGNPFYVYHTTLWTLLHQITAVLLWAGLSEIAASKLISGLLGMIGFQALAVLVYALSRNAPLAIASTLVIFLTGAAEEGHVYPVRLMGTSDTYGVLGLSTFTLVVALFGAGCVRSGAALLGLAPAIHPSLGAWLWAAIAACVLWGGRTRDRGWRPALTYFAAGCAVTALSLLVQLAAIADRPDAEPAAVAAAFNAFVAGWDYHRAAVRLASRSVAVNAAALSLAIACLLAFGEALSRAATFILRFVIVTSLMGLTLMFVSWLPPDRVPALLLILMPSRLLAFDAMVLAALALGLLGSCRSRALGVAAPIALMLLMVAARPHLVRERVRWDPYWSDFEDRTNSAFLAAVAAERRGLLATGGSLHLIQLVTRRPVLIDGGGLDTLPYARDAGPAMQRILLDVYGLDLLNPPEEARGGAVIPDSLNKTTWQGYSRARWQQLARTYDITQVLAPADWSLDLPVVAEDEALRLHRIPE